MEWTIVTVIVVLLGLVVTVMTPLIKLNSSLTKLNVTLTALDVRMTRIETDNHNSHARIWTKNEEQDGRLANHDQRLVLLEHDKE